MSRNKNLKKLMRYLEYLHRKDVENLMKSGKKQELLEIVKDCYSSGKVNFSMIKNWVKYQRTGFQLQVSEIPKRYLFDLIFYVNRSRLADCFAFDSWQEWQKTFRESDDDFMQHVAKLMEFDSLGSYSLEELLYGIPEEKGK